MSTPSLPASQMYLNAYRPLLPFHMAVRIGLTIMSYCNATDKDKYRQLVALNLFLSTFGIPVQTAPKKNVIDYVMEFAPNYHHDRPMSPPAFLPVSHKIPTFLVLVGTTYSCFHMKRTAPVGYKSPFCHCCPLPPSNSPAC